MGRCKTMHRYFTARLDELPALHVAMVRAQSALSVYMSRYNFAAREAAYQEHYRAHQKRVIAGQKTTLPEIRAEHRAWYALHTKAYRRLTGEAEDARSNYTFVREFIADSCYRESLT